MNVKSYSVSTARVERDYKNFRVQDGNGMKEGRTNKSTQKSAIKDFKKKA